METSDSSDKIPPEIEERLFNFHSQLSKVEDVFDTLFQEPLSDVHSKVHWNYQMLQIVFFALRLRKCVLDVIPGKGKAGFAMCVFNELIVLG